jgi:hypothetical protein
MAVFGGFVMKFVRIPVLCAVILLALTSGAWAQFIDCDTLTPSIGDTVYTDPGRSLPGDTLLLPLVMSNSVAMTSFATYMEYDSSIMKPIVVEVDTLFDDVIIGIDTTIVGNDTTVDTQIVFDSAVAVKNQYDFQYASRYIGPDPDNPDFDEFNPVQVINEIDFPPSSPTRQRLIVQATGFYDMILEPGTGPVVYIPMVIDSSAEDGTQSVIDFYDETIWIVDFTPGDPFGDTVGNSCLYSQYSDTVGGFGSSVKLHTRQAVHTVDTSQIAPTIQSFSANPSSVDASGDQTTLSWQCSAADSVRLVDDFGLVDQWYLGNSGSQQVTVRPSNPYTITAVNRFGAANQSLTVPIGDDPVNSPPAIVTNPSGTTVEIEQGSSVTYTLTATDADGDGITLAPSNVLPPNATFGPTNPVVGTSPVVGNFSFTPDINQSGTYNFTFTATDDAVTPASGSVTITVIVNEIERDRLFTTSADGFAPVGGIAGTEAVFFPINLVSAQDVYGVQFDLIYDESLFDIDSIITTARTADFVVWDNIGQTPGEVRIITFGMANELVQQAESSEILYVVMSIDDDATPGDYEFRIEEGWESVDPDPSVPSLELLVDNGVMQVDRPGDVNLDKLVNVADLVNIVGYIIGDYGFDTRQFNVADVTTDVLIDVFDLVAVINLIYEVDVVPAPGSEYTGGYARIQLDHSDLTYGANDVLTVRSELPTDIAGAQLELAYDPNKVIMGAPELAQDADGMTLRYRDNGQGKLLMLMHFTNPASGDQLIHAGDADLVKIPIQSRAELEAGDSTAMKLSKALLSTSTASAVAVDGMGATVPNSFTLYQNYPNPFNPTTTIEFEIAGSQPAEVSLDIFNVLGQRVRNLMEDTRLPGLHQVDWDATSDDGDKVATGVYFYRLQVGDQSEAKKMLLLK